MKVTIDDVSINNIPKGDNCTLEVIGTSTSTPRRKYSKGFNVVSAVHEVLIDIDTPIKMNTMKLTYTPRGTGKSVMIVVLLQHPIDLPVGPQQIPITIVDDIN